MASKVNKKFVVVLVLAVVAVAAAVLVAGKFAVKSGADHFEAGKAWEAKGDIEKAVGSYAKAVNKDHARVDYMEAWIAALEKITPGSLQAYRDRFQLEYMPARAALAQAKETDAEAQKPLLDLYLFINTEFGTEATGWEAFAKQVSEVIGRIPAGDKGGQTLRRYRGIARMKLAERSGLQSEENMVKAKEDLEAAVAADPADAKSLAALGDWFKMAIAFARQRRETDKTAPLIKEARDRMEAFIAANKVNLPVMFSLVRLNMEEDQYESTGATFKETLAKYQPRVKRLIDQALAEPPEKIDRVQAFQIGAMAIAVAYENAIDEATKILEHVFKARPNDVYLVYHQGEMELAAGQHDRAFATLDRLVKMADLPLSLDGLLLFTLREEAMYRQARSLLDQLDASSDEARRGEFLTRTKAVREEIANRFGTSPATGLLDAQIKYYEGDLVEARRLLSKYTAQKPNDPVALRLQALVYMRTQLTGEAQITLEKLVDLNPNDVRALIELARVNKSLGRTKEAGDALERVLVLMPKNEELKQEVARLRSAQAGTKSDDQLVKVLSQAQEKLQGQPPDIQGALEMVRGLRQDLEKANKLDLRASASIMQALMMLDDREGAAELFGKLSEKERQEPFMQSLELQIKNPDPVAAQLAAIDRTSIEPINKHLLRYRVYRKSGRETEALEALRQGTELGPENPLVVSAAFDEALARFEKSKAPADIAEAKRLADLATRLDIDKLQGKVFRIRIEEAEGRLPAAAAMAQEIVDKDPSNPLGHRLVGVLRMSMGRYAEALTAFATAARIKPDDPENIKGQLRALSMVNRANDALKVARDARPLVGGDMEFFRILLALEGEYGNADYAIEGWRRLRKQFANDRQARLALGQLLIKKEAWPEAGQAIDEAAALQSDFTSMNLKATWLARQGKMPEAKAVWEKYVADQPADKRDVMLFVAFAEFLGNNGDNAAAKKILEDNRQLQTVKNAEVDRELGDLGFRIGDYAGCVEALTRALKSVEKDDGNRLRYRIIDCHLRMKQCDEAMKLCDAAVVSGVTEDQTLFLLRSEAAICQKDYESAKKYLDRGVAAGPNEALGFFKRGGFSIAQVNRMRGANGRVPPEKEQDAQQILKDAEDDLSQALRLENTFAMARRLLSQVRLSRGSVTDAIKVLAEGLTIEPRNSDVRRDMIGLLEQTGKVDEALRLCDEGTAIDGHPQWMLMKATLLLHQQGQGAKAAEAFGEAWNKGARGPEVARLYSDTLMSQPKPDLDRILVVLAAPQNQIDSWSPLLTMRARVYRLQGRVADSDADIQAAFKVLNQQNASAVASFFQDMSEMYSGRTGEMLAAIEALKPPEGFSEAFRIQVIRFKLMQKDLQEAALRDLDEMVANAPNKQAVQIALRQMGDLMFVERNYEMAAELYRRVLQVNPADFDTMNNLAYTLSKFLQKHDQAEPYAHKAAEASPANPNILDTYGSVLLALGRVPESEAMFQRALAGANRADQQVPLWIHMAQVSLAKGERPGAVDYLQKADREIGRSPELRGRFGPEYDEVKRKVDGGR